MSDLRLFVGVKGGQHEGVPLHSIAVWNEYGTEMIPPRPAFRMGTEAALKKSKKLITAQLSNIARAGLGKSKPSKKLMRDREIQLLTGIGKSAVKEVKAIIKSGSTERNAPATISKKGFDHPLFETGLLQKNLDFVVSE